MIRLALNSRTAPRLLAAFACILLLGSASALAAEAPGPPTPPPGPGVIPAPGWQVTANSYPTRLAPGGQGTIGIDVFNVGAKASHGEVTVTDTLPPGVTATNAGDLRFLRDGLTPQLNHLRWDCTGNGPAEAVAGATVVTCTNDPQELPEISGGGGAPSNNEENPILMPSIGITVTVGTESPVAPNRVIISGGGAPTAASTSDPIAVSSVPPPFGFSSADAWFSNADGTIDTLAGSHPYEATFAFNLATEADPHAPDLLPVGGEPRHLQVQLPPGLIADPTAVPQCTRADLAAEKCPQASIIGTDSAYFASGIAKGFPVYNMVPPPGVAVQFAFSFGGILAFLDSSVRTGADYSAFTSVQVPQKVLAQNIITLWGVPGESSHNLWRNGELGGCTQALIEGAGSSSEGLEEYCVAPHFPTLKPLLTLPTSCGRPAPLLFQADNWQSTTTTEIGFQLHDPNGAPTTFQGCEQLGFRPALSAASDTAEAEAPVGVSFDLRPDLGGLQERGLRANSNIKKVTVTMPKGFVVNPARAAGLQDCSLAQSAIGTEGPANCPTASKIGTARVQTPLLEGAEEKELIGDVYLLPSDPPHLHLLVAASADGVHVKLIGIADLDESEAGRITTVFGEQPQVEAEEPALAGHLRVPDLPFTSFTLSLDGGPKASLITPSECGTYQAAASFTPWASPSLPDLGTDVPLAVSGGPRGAACPSTPLPFSPELAAGTTNPSAGSAPTSFVVKVSRAPAQQNLKAIDVTLPPGQLAKLAGVPLCPEAATAAGNCPASSQVGSVSAAVGPGAEPLQVPQPGKAPTAAYLAGPYKGAPYSLVIKVPAQAGPFDLGTVVVRTALHVNETTAQVTAKSDPLPQILDGVPLSYQSVTVSADRPGFIQNPTNCEPMKVTAAVSGSEGATSNLSNRYQVGDCAALGFKPALKLHLSGQTRRAGHPALKAVLTYPKKGSYANVARAQVSLPGSEFLDQGNLNLVCKQADLKAGTCPKSSIYGKVKAWTPLLERPLTGNVYLGVGFGYKLPALVAELNGQIRVLLVGKVDTDRHKGIRNTFLAVPDAPVSRFVLEMKGGKKYGLLENSENICRKTQKAEASFTGQNGKVEMLKPTITNSCGKGKKSMPRRGR